MNIFEHISTIIDQIISWMGAFGPFFGCVLICFESILPFLPLSVFITVNFLSFGTIIGFFISWFFTVIGCVLSYFLFEKGFQKKISAKRLDKKTLNKWMCRLESLSLTQLAVIIAMPFTPAFLVNIAAGISHMSFKKFLVAILIGKLFMVYFWGFVGTTLIQSLTNPMALIKVIALMLGAYIISYIVNKIYKLD